MNIHFLDCFEATGGVKNKPIAVFLPKQINTVIADLGIINFQDISIPVILIDYPEFGTGRRLAG